MKHMTSQLPRLVTLFVAGWVTTSAMGQPAPMAGQTIIGQDAAWWDAIPNQAPMNGWELATGRIYATTSPLWVEGQYLYAWIRGNQLPALATTSPGGTARSAAGVLGAGGSQVVFGDRGVDGGGRPGFRVALGARLGYWFDHLRDTELESSLDWLGDGLDSGTFFEQSSGNPILARPFFNVLTGLQDSQLVAFPGLAAGNLSISTDSQWLSAGLRLRHVAWRSARARLDWLAGYRYAQFREELLVAESLESGDPAASVPVGTLFDVSERFATWNEFHGADLGLQLWTDIGRWTVELLAKVAIGGNMRTVEINGSTLVVPPGSAASLTAGGLYALPTNMGRHQSTRFTAIPEVGIRVRRRLSHSFIFTAGYSVLVMDRVARSGEQIDVAVNPSQMGNGALAGLPRPQPLMGDSTLWIHGFQVGLEW